MSQVKLFIFYTLILYMEYEIIMVLLKVAGMLRYEFSCRIMSQYVNYVTTCHNYVTICHDINYNWFHLFMHIISTIHIKHFWSAKF